MFMPGFGETLIPPRARVSFALMLCLVIYPLTPIAPNAPEAILATAQLLFAEVMVGLWIGLAARTLLTALEFTGHIVGQVSGLTNAFGPSLGSFQGATLVSTFLMLAAIALIFATNTHHIALIALLESYAVFPVGQLHPEDWAEQIVRTGSKSLYIGATVAIPFLIMGVILNLGMGLANRMMPQLPVFFVAASLLIGSGLLMLTFATPTILGTFLKQYIGLFRELGF